MDELLKTFDPESYKEQQMAETSYEQICKDITSLKDDIAEIKNALIGTFDKQGLIGLVKESIPQMDKRLLTIEGWIMEKNKLLSMLGWKVVGILVTGIFSGSGLLWIILKVLHII